MFVKLHRSVTLFEYVLRVRSSSQNMNDVLVYDSYTQRTVGNHHIYQLYKPIPDVIKMYKYKPVAELRSEIKDHKLRVMST